MTDRIPATAVDGLEYAWVGDNEINARDQAGRAALAQAIADARVGTPVKLRAKVYAAGYNRNDWTLKPGELVAYSRTAKGKPVLYRDHEPFGAVIGRVDKCWAAKSDGAKKANELYQDITVWGEPALADLGNGIMPQFSIHAQPGEETIASCTVCGEDYNDADSECSHWPGLRYDGQRASIQYSGDLTHSETTWTYSPAVPGTGLASTSPSADHVQAVAQRRDEARKQRQIQARQHEETMTEKRDQAPEQKPSAPEPAAVDAKKVPDTVAAQIADLREQLKASERAREDEAKLRERLTAQVEMMAIERMTQESKRIVRDLRARGKLIGDESVALELRAKNAEVFDGAMAMVPENHAYSVGQKTGTATSNGPLDLSTAYGLSQALKAAIEANPDANREDLFIQLRNQAEPPPGVQPIQRGV